MYPIYFLKAIANQSGYYLSGSPPRWHKWNKDRPAPADAHAVVSHASHVKAVQKLKAGHHAAPMDPQQMHSEVVALGTHLAAQANALARLADVRKKILAGQKPQKNEIAWAWKAPAEKRDAVIAEIQAKGNTESLKLLDEFLAAKPLDKDEAIQAAIDHLAEDSKQPDIPADEHKEDAELVAKLKAPAGPEKVVPVGPVTIKPTPKDSLSVAPVVKDSLSTAPVAEDSLPVKTELELNGEKFKRRADGSWTDEWGEPLDHPAYSAALEVIAGGSVDPHKVYAWSAAYRSSAANYFVSLGADATQLLNSLFPVNNWIGSPFEGEVKVVNGTTYAVQGGKWALPAQKPKVISYTFKGETFTSDGKGKWWDKDGYVASIYDTVMLSIAFNHKVDPDTLSGLTEHNKETLLITLAPDDISVEDALNGLFPQNGPLGNESYPTEGDTKEVKGVLYVLHNGRWHKQADIPVVVAVGKNTYKKDGDNWVGPNSEVITPDHDFMWLALEIANGAEFPQKIIGSTSYYSKIKSAEWLAENGYDPAIYLSKLFPPALVPDGVSHTLNGKTWVKNGDKWQTVAKQAPKPVAIHYDGINYTKNPDGTWSNPLGFKYIVGQKEWLEFQVAAGLPVTKDDLGKTDQIKKMLAAANLGDLGHDPAHVLAEIFPDSPNGFKKEIAGKGWVKENDKWQQVVASAQLGPFFPGGNTYTKQGNNWKDTDGFYYKPGDEVWLALEIANGADITQNILNKYSEASRQFVAEWLADKDLDVPYALQALFPYSTDYPKAVDGSVKSVNGVHYQMMGGFWENEDAKNTSTNGGSEPPQEVVSADGLTFTLGADGKWLNEFGGTLIPISEVALNLHAGLPHNMTTSQIKSGEFQKEVLEWMSDRGFNVPNGLEAFMPTWVVGNGAEWDVQGKSYIAKDGKWQLNDQAKPHPKVTTSYGDTYSLVNGSWVGATGKKIAPYAEVALNIHAGLPTGLGPAKEIHADLRDNVLFFMGMKDLDVSKGLDTFFPGSMFGDGMNWPVEGKNYVLKNGKWHEVGKSVKLDYKGNDYVLGANGQWVMNGGHKVSKATGVMLSLAAGQAVDLNVAANFQDDTKNLLLDSYVPDMVPAEQALNTLYPPHGPDGTWSHPTEGDTKTVNGVVYVLHNGRWHKQSPVAASPTPPASGKHPIYSVEAPSFEDLDKYFKPLAANKIDKALALLRTQIKHGDVTSLKNSTKFMKATGKYIIRLPGGKVGGNDVYFGVHGSGPGVKMVYDYVNALKAVVSGKAPPKVAIPKAAPTPVQPPQPPVSPGQPFDIGAWKEKPGTQGGYNPGGEYTDPQGKKWYVKFPASEEAARTEVLANALYTLTGAYVPKVRLIQKNGKIGIASQWIDGAVVDKAALKSGTLTGAREFFAADAWLANYDVVGNNPAPGKGWDNIVNVGGKALRVEAGGALDHKGSGGKKPFGDKVTDLSTFRDPSINPNTAAVFGAMTNEEIADSVAAVSGISDDTIKGVVDMFGAGDAVAKAKMADTLIKRRDDMAMQFPGGTKKAAKKAHDVVTPEDMARFEAMLKPGEKIVKTSAQFGIKTAEVEVPPGGHDPSAFQTPPPDFFKIGSQGPTHTWHSSKEHVNQANNDIGNTIQSLAIQGDVQALENLTFTPISKETGSVAGAPLPILSGHPSGKLKEYYTNTLAELQAQFKATTRGLQIGSLSGSLGRAISALADRFKVVSYSAFATCQRAADYVILSHGGASFLNVPEHGQPTPFKEMPGQDKDLQAFKSASDAKFNKLTSAQKSACKSYTGSAYHEWNSALRKGEVGSHYFNAAQTMVKAFEQSAVDLPAGTIVWRGIDVGESTYSSVQGGIVQDGSFNSASYGTKPAFSGKPTWLRIHVPDAGVKAVMATTFSSFDTGEREIIVQNNSRYAVVRVRHYDEFITSDGGVYHNKTIVDVIALPHQ